MRVRVAVTLGDQSSVIPKPRRPCHPELISGSIRQAWYRSLTRHPMNDCPKLQRPHITRAFLTLDRLPVGKGKFGSHGVPNESRKG